MKIRLLIVCLLCAWLVPGKGQQVLGIRTNKPFYTSGEMMGVVVSNNSGAAVEIIYVELLDSKGNMLNRVTAKSDGIVAAAVFPIPLDWASNWYIIRAYNIWMPTLTIKDIGYKAVLLYNEFDQGEINQTVAVTKTPSSNRSIQISPDKDEYHKGEIAGVTIRETGAGMEPTNTRFAVTVLERSTYDLFSFFETIEPNIPIPAFEAPSAQGRPQTKLLYLGKLDDESDKFLAAFYVAEEGAFSWVSINDDNIFGLEMNDFKGKKSAQLLGVEALGGIVSLDPALFYLSTGMPFPELSLPDLPYTKEILDYLDASRKRRIIDDLFNKVNKQKTAEQAPISLFIKADKSYNPEDYIRFTDTQDFINEVVTFAKLRRTNSSYSFRVLMEKNRLAAFEPILFLNGYMATDTDELIDLDLDKIERIDVYRRESTILKQFSTLGRNGVVAFYTKDPTVKPSSGSKLELEGFQEEQPLIKPSISLSLPSFSPSLYWNPSLNINATGEATFSFGITDDRGEYVILVERFSEGGSVRAASSVYIKGKN